MLLWGRSFGTPRRGRIEEGSSSHHRSDAHAAADRVAPRPDGTPAPRTTRARAKSYRAWSWTEVSGNRRTTSSRIATATDGWPARIWASAARTRRSASEGEICRIHEAWLHAESASRASSSERRLTGSAPGAASPRAGPPFDASIRTLALSSAGSRHAARPARGIVTGLPVQDPGDPALEVQGDGPHRGKRRLGCDDRPTEPAQHGRRGGEAGGSPGCVTVAIRPDHASRVPPQAARRGPLIPKTWRAGSRSVGSDER
jgi:hypothetical protein